MGEKGINCFISEKTVIGENVKFGNNCIVEDDVVIGNNVFIDSNTIIRSGVAIEDNSFIASNCIIGEYWMDFCIEREVHKHPLKIGKNAIIRSGTIIYAGSEIGDNFQTGHYVTIRENNRIGKNVSIGTASDIQKECTIGDYVRIHSNVFMGEMIKIDSFVWIFPNVVFTNDPTPPSNTLLGPHVHSFAVIAAAAVILPGVEIAQDSLVGAGAVVTHSTTEYAVVVGNPAKKIEDIRNIKDKNTDNSAYPWRNYFKRAMPWKESDFESWYNSLKIEELNKYKLDI